MTKDDIMKLARKAGLFTHKDVQPEILAFANLVAAHKTEIALAEAYRCGYEAGGDAHQRNIEQAANKLRKLHEVNQELLAALKALSDADKTGQFIAGGLDYIAIKLWIQARAAIDKADACGRSTGRRRMTLKMVSAPSAAST